MFEKGYGDDEYVIKQVDIGESSLYPHAVSPLVPSDEKKLKKKH